MIIVVCYALRVLVVGLLRSGYCVLIDLLVLCLLVSWFVLFCDFVLFVFVLVVLFGCVWFGLLFSWFCVGLIIVMLFYSLCNSVVF